MAFLLTCLLGWLEDLGAVRNLSVHLVTSRIDELLHMVAQVFKNKHFSQKDRLCVYGPCQFSLSKPRAGGGGIWVGL